MVLFDSPYNLHSNLDIVEFIDHTDGKRLQLSYIRLIFVVEYLLYLFDTLEGLVVDLVMKRDSYVQIRVFYIDLKSRLPFKYVWLQISNF